ncbi:MAG TPA: LysR family transcriptional regulator [Gemmataceae bacterium]|nr:LysR family transcriptional regulator [Gemmataceae bacterium]
MQFESLKLFCDVARQRSFSQAAQVNGVTQSAASQVVSLLEKRMGVQLIDRSTRPLQLTHLGQSYYEGCKALLDQYMELEASIRTAQAQLARTIRVAAIYSVGLGDMGQCVQNFQASHPDVRVHLEYLHPDRVYEKVREGTADLGLVSFPRKMSKLVAMPWREEEMVLACSPVHPLAANLAVRPSQLDGVKYIHFDKDLAIRREVDRFLRDLGINVEVVLEFDNIENIKKAVELGAGVALLPEPTLRREVEEHSLVARGLHGSRLVRPLGIIRRRHLKQSNSALRFVDMLCAANGHVGPVPSGNGHAHGASTSGRRAGKTRVS